MDDGVGATLKAARTRRKLDLSEVEASTRIRVGYLRAIEAEEWDALPADTYVRGFIRTYATYLGLDGARLAEQHRRELGVVRPAERIPSADPAPVRASRQRRRPRLSPRAAAVAVSAALVAVLVVVGLSTGGGESTTPSPPPRSSAGGHPETNTADAKPIPQPGISLKLATSAEVWVCLLDANGEPLVDSQILGPGAVEGPYRSGSFTVSLGNGEVTMTVDGQQASIPETSSPIGFQIGRGGGLRELSEGERPTCT